MGLAVAVFVPEGIVIASDGLSEIRNSQSDHDFLQKKQQRLFSFQGKYLVCVQGYGYIKGLPYSYHIHQILATLSPMSFKTTEAFCVQLKDKLTRLQDPDDHIVLYVAGMDVQEDSTVTPAVYLVDDQKHYPINKSHHGEVVYNFHSIGRSLWMNKLWLPTHFDAGQGQRIDFEDTQIDFSKYSLQEAIDFGKSMLEISCKMDRFAQLKPMVGEFVSIGCLTLDQEVRIFANESGG